MDRSETVQDESQGPSATYSAELVGELRAHNTTLREQLEAEREANRENRRIIAALTSRIPELEAPQERPPDAPRGAAGGVSREEEHPVRRRRRSGGRRAPVMVEEGVRGVRSGSPAPASLNPCLILPRGP